MLHEPIFNVTRDNFQRNFVEATVGYGMLHETTFNATLSAITTMLPVFDSLLKTCNMLPQRNVALKKRPVHHFIRDVDQCCVKNRLV